MASRVPILIVGNSVAMHSRVSTILSLNPHWEVCDEVSDGKRAIEIVLELRPQVILLDSSGLVASAFEWIHEIRRIVSASRLVVIGTH
jgi:chemotaxis response regulator CheB